MPAAQGETLLVARAAFRLLRGNGGRDSSPCVEGSAFDANEGGGWNATGLARHLHQWDRTPTGELSPMAFLVGVRLAELTAPSPPPQGKSSRGLPTPQTRLNHSAPLSTRLLPGYDPDP